MAVQITTKTGVSASVLKAALKAMQTLKANKVYVTLDGYIFPKECDVRSYVGKDGKYETLTKADCVPKEVKAKTKADKDKTEAKTETGTESGQNEEKGGSADRVIDEHKKEE